MSTGEYNFKALLEMDSSRAVADLVVSAIGNNPEHFKTVLDLCFNETYPVAMRAARAIELCCEENPILIEPYLDEIIDKIQTSKIDGVKRGLLKVVRDVDDIRKIKNIGLLTKLCFDWMSDKREAIAVRHYCTGILLRIVEIEPDLKNELIAVLENEIQLSDSTAFKKRTTKMIKKLTNKNKHAKNYYCDIDIS